MNVYLNMRRMWRSMKIKVRILILQEEEKEVDGE